MTEHDDTPRDPALSYRYREAGAECDMAPPPVLDARILAAAREAVPSPSVTSRSLRPWWRRLALPVGVMAGTVLAVMLSLTVQRHTPETPEHQVRDSQATRAPAAPASTRPSAAPEPASPSPAPVAERTDGAPPAPAVSVAPIERGGRMERMERSSRAVERVEPQPAAPARPVLPAPPSAAAGSNAASAAGAVVSPSLPAVSGEAAAAASRLKAETSADRAQEAEASTPLQKAAPATAAPARLGASRGDVTPTASAWIEEIRELKRQGRADEAARRLAEFRKAYPEYVLPGDFR